MECLNRTFEWVLYKDAVIQGVRGMLARVYDRDAWISVFQGCWSKCLTEIGHGVLTVMLYGIFSRAAGIIDWKGCWMNCLTKMLGGVFHSYHCMAYLQEMLRSILDSEAEWVFEKNTWLSNCQGWLITCLTGTVEWVIVSNDGLIHWQGCWIKCLPLMLHRVVDSDAGLVVCARKLDKLFDRDARLSGW